MTLRILSRPMGGMAWTNRVNMGRMNLAVGKYSGSVHGNDPDTLAREKARNLSGTQDSSSPHKEHAPQWNEVLATDSEAGVKADQAGPPGKPSKALQEQTIFQTHKHHHDEDDGMHKGVKHHKAKHEPTRTGSEEAVKADRGEH
ncbi:hypothetical protein TREMEDRAFT_73912 [Tremella mesenterica DSM 1558]|uniref:uncharacterized protein n=1 Tax=Tremella mesenterica (strain ATCC 24925 / CBS 8224 / DSM 1558 / NBRC 9311 / NRRL Y-6157 / RJB 2259-6 / UBC 559-6) TaxID=578456 RepID=UPI0003F49AC3|nr:uncharacterized protein TREMEDRAFT_73912 [Tremella mesenterica DSM 1558]EIW69594.1 hypothetical protein TREMEDRAFT_73912 [Tremella mesenterica DSM 1558]